MEIGTSKKPYKIDKTKNDFLHGMIGKLKLVSYVLVNTGTTLRACNLDSRFIKTTNECYYN